MLIDKKNDTVKFDNFPTTNGGYISVKYACVRFFNSYSFLSSSLDSLVKTFVDISHKTLKKLKKEIVDDDEMLNIVNKIKIVTKEDKYSNDSIEYLKKDFPDEIKKLEEASNSYISESDLKFLKTEFTDEWKYLNRKLAYPYEFFNSIDDSQKPVNKLKKEYFFTELKNTYPSDEEIEQTKQILICFLLQMVKNYRNYT